MHNIHWTDNSPQLLTSCYRHQELPCPSVLQTLCHQGHNVRLDTQHHHLGLPHHFEVVVSGLTAKSYQWLQQRGVFLRDAGQDLDKEYQPEDWSISLCTYFISFH